MTGIFGFYSFGEERERWNGLRFLYYGLQALQGRGSESVSLAWLGPNGFETYSTEGDVDAIRYLVEKSRGHIAIGMVSSYRDDPVAVIESPLRLALVVDGMPSLGNSRSEAFTRLAETMSELLGTGLSPLDAGLRLISQIGGGYSFIALTERGEMVAGRSRLGVKPLSVGSIGFDIACVSSETAALDVVGASFSSELSAGEIISMSLLSLKRGKVEGAAEALCSFEFVYMARNDSTIMGVPVYLVRERIGEALAARDEVKVDVVTGVPETALAFASGYAGRRGIRCRLGFVRTGQHVRSALKPTQLERLIGLQLKLNPIAAAVDGRDIVLIDDSVVRGNTLKNVVALLRRKGAQAVHVRVGSPPIRYSCPFGTEIPPPDELIARDLPIEEIEKLVGCDSLAFLDLEELVKAIGLPPKVLCLGCFTGHYPEEVRTR